MSFVDLLNSAGNPAMKALLRSPAHGLASGKFLLMTVRGRKTGRAYTLPVNYTREGDALTIVSRAERTWWRNAREDAPVVVWLRGREQRGAARVVATGRAGAARLQEYYLRLRGQRLSDEEAAAMAEGKVVVEVRLGAGRA